jgi:hypothetical protein
MIEAVIKANEKKEKEAKADYRRETKNEMERDARLVRQEHERARRQAERARKETERIAREEEAKRKKREEAYELIAKLPRISHEVKLAETAKRLGKDIEILRADFEAFYVPDPTDTSFIEPWEESVDTRALLQELVAEIRRYVVVHDLDLVAAVLWVVFAWLHDLATHSAFLVVTSAEGDNGKTLLCRVLARLTPRALFITDPTGGNIYRIVDQTKPTMFVDDADKLFQRDRNLVTLFNASWLRGALVPRMVRGELYYFDPFCPKCLNMIGLIMPPQTLTRCIVVRVPPKLPEEKVDHFDYQDNPGFIALRRKCMRWAADNAPALHGTYPEDIDRRVGDNWRFLLLVADLAAGDWAQRTRAAVDRTRPKRHQKPLNNQLLAAIRPILRAHKVIFSVELAELLAADKDSGWSSYGRHGRARKCG